MGSSPSVEGGVEPGAALPYPRSRRRGLHCSLSEGCCWSPYSRSGDSGGTVDRNRGLDGELADLTADAGACVVRWVHFNPCREQLG